VTNLNKRGDISVNTLRKKQKTDAMMLGLMITLAVTLATTNAVIIPAALAQNPPICSDENATLVVRLAVTT
jgi:hypothetical protein